MDKRRDRGTRVRNSANFKSTEEVKQKPLQKVASLKRANNLNVKPIGLEPAVKKNDYTAVSRKDEGTSAEHKNLV